MNDDKKRVKCKKKIIIIIKYIKIFENNLIILIFDFLLNLVMIINICLVI